MHDRRVTDVEVLTGPRVTLRAPVAGDAEPLFATITSDPQVARYMSWRAHADVDETRWVIDKLFNVGGETTWLIEHRGDVLGVIGWRRPQPHVIDFGYYLGRPWWGRGFMSEAVALIVDKAAVLRRGGLVLEGRLARYTVLPNISDEPQDCLLLEKAVR